MEAIFDSVIEPVESVRVAPRWGRSRDRYLHGAGQRSGVRRNPYFGFSSVIWDSVPDQLLSNGRRESGFAITGADIFLNTTRLLETQQEFSLPIEIVALALTRLLGHEIGHALGLGHPDEQRNFDYDFDPFDVEAILSHAPCGPVLQACSALFHQTPRPDDRLGRDLLYGVPEQAAPLLGLTALGALAVIGSGRSRGPSDLGNSLTRRVAGRLVKA